MFTLEYAKNPVYENEQGTFINLIVKFKEFNEELPFGASPDDCEAHGREIFARAKAGEFGTVAAYVAPIQSIIDFEPTSTSNN
jgi:hypothetical protein